MTTDVIVLNGGSSSGTSTLARALQDTLPTPWLTFGVDAFIAALPPRLLDSPDGLLRTADGQVTAGPAFRALETGWRHGIAATARAGARVILDEVFLGGRTGQDAWRSALDGLNVLWVGVHCAPETATARERTRPDRIPGMAAAQAHLVHRDVTYDLRIDTGHTSPADCAREIAGRVR